MTTREETIAARLTEITQESKQLQDRQDVLAKEKDALVTEQSSLRDKRIELEYKERAERYATGTAEDKARLYKEAWNQLKVTFETKTNASNIKITEGRKWDSISYHLGPWCSGLTILKATGDVYSSQKAKTVLANILSDPPRTVLAKLRRM